eukprot:7700020-Pyramimonas_sp.AAC.2
MSVRNLVRGTTPGRAALGERPRRATMAATGHGGASVGVAAGLHADGDVVRVRESERHRHVIRRRHLARHKVVTSFGHHGVRVRCAVSGYPSCGLGSRQGTADSEAVRVPQLRTRKQSGYPTAADSEAVRVPQLRTRKRTRNMDAQSPAAHSQTVE